MGLMTKFGLYMLAAVGLSTAMFFTNFTFESEDQNELFVKSENKRSITFLMGQDNEGYQYFELAEEHFLFDEKEKTDVMVKSCRSIEDMINYLNNDVEQTPWSTIQVVLHGNPYNGLSLPIVNEGPRATPKQLVKTVMDNPLPVLNTSNIDSTTKINFWGCGIGKNPFIKIALDTFLTKANGVSPKIYASPHFVIFNKSNDGSPAKRLKASYWPYVFKRGYRPGDYEIEQAMKEQFPEAQVDWLKAIDKRNNDLSNNQFQDSFHIPVSWTVIYPTKESRPSVSTEDEKMTWVQGQEELMRQVEELNIPLDKFTWTVNKIIHTNPDGSKVPAIKAIGMATVLCVLEV